MGKKTAESGGKQKIKRCSKSSSKSGKIKRPKIEWFQQEISQINKQIQKKEKYLKSLNTEINKLAGNTDNREAARLKELKDQAGNEKQSIADLKKKEERYQNQKGGVQEPMRCDKMEAFLAEMQSAKPNENGLYDLSAVAIKNGFKDAKYILTRQCYNDFLKWAGKEPWRTDVCGIGGTRESARPHFASGHCFSG